MKKNVPNFLLLIRISMVPIIMVLLIVSIYNNNFAYTSNNLLGTNWTDIAAGIIFIICSFTDWLDGWWARKFNQVTTFGKFFDPLADKILVNTVLIIFSSRGIVPIAFVVIFIIRDILVDGLRMMLSTKGTILPAHKLGKLKTVFQMVGLSLLFFIHTIFNCENIKLWNTTAYLIQIPLTFGLFFSIASGFDYYIKGYKIIK